MVDFPPPCASICLQAATCRSRPGGDACSQAARGRISRPVGRVGNHLLRGGYAAYESWSAVLGRVGRVGIRRGGCP